MNRSAHIRNLTDNELEQRYNRIASYYDSQRYDCRAGSFLREQERQLIRNWIPPSPDTKVLDVPCGTGKLMLPLAEMCGEVIAADLSRGMLDQACQHAQRHELDNVRFARVNLRHLPFCPNTFDAVVCVNFFHLLPRRDWAQMIRQLDRVLKPGGVLVLEFKNVLTRLISRLWFRRRTAPQRCFLPGCNARLLRDFEPRGMMGLGFPMVSHLTGILDSAGVSRLDASLGRCPGIRLLAGVMMLRLQKPNSNSVNV